MRLWQFVKDHWGFLDVALAFIAGAVISVLGLFNVVEGDALTQATVAVLSVLAFSALHDRIERRDSLAALTRRLDDTAQAVQRSVDEVTSEWPYHQISYDAAWDITSRDMAVATKKKQIRFTRDNVTSITERGEPSGTTEEYSVFGGKPGEDPVKLDSFGEIRDEQWHLLKLVGLKRQWKKGEVMDLEVRRTLRNSFPSEEEAVSVQLSSPTEQATITVKWPADAPPRSLSLTRTIDGPPEPIPISLDDLADEDGRRVLKRHAILKPTSGGQTTLRWRW